MDAGGGSLTIGAYLHEEGIPSARTNQESSMIEIEFREGWSYSSSLGAVGYLAHLRFIF